MMFKPSHMERIRLVVHKRYSEQVMSALQDIGVMQIESLPESALKFLNMQDGVEYKHVSDYAQRFRGLEGLLYSRGSDQKFSFADMNELIARAQSVRIDDRVGRIRKELDDIEANLKDDSSKLSLLDRISDFHGDLAILNTKSIVSYAVYGPKQQLDILEKSAATKGRVLKTKLERAIIFSSERGNEKEFAGLVEGNQRITVEVVPQMAGTMVHNRNELERKVSSLMRAKRGLEDELADISEKMYPLVSALREQFDIEMEKYEVLNKVGTTRSIIAFEGWVPHESLGGLEKLVRRVTDGRFVLESIKTGEMPPTRMHNPVTMRLYEFFVRFYSIPKSEEIDPTIMFALAFPIFFGFMVGDAGYGLVMLLLALFIIHRVDHPPKRSRLPKMLTSFITLLVTPKSLKILAKSIIPGAIIAMLLGAAFNEYFGFQLPYAALFNVEAGLGTLLVVSGWIGVFMVEFGFFLGFLNKWSNGEHRHAIAKLGWMMAGAGFVIFGLNILHQQPMGLGSISAVASYALLVLGIIVLVAFEGARGLMELPSLISHMLSYTRLVGILLASVILAGVVDLIFIGGWHHSILLGIVGTVILVVGQLFNIIIALFEPGIQGARLIYVEFFSKFFEGNGRIFKPFATQRSRTVAQFRLDEKRG
jgi:V/A-type H+/Na+-transporting ATPase subunit I